jgi:DNA-binding SARP family transcriptional activator
MMPVLHLRLLGGFQIIAGSTVVTTVNTPRLQSLLAYLVLHADAPQPRRQIAFCLWPDLPEARARANLRKLLYQLQQALPDAPRFLRADTHTLQWQPGAPFSLDVAEFETHAASPADLGRAVELYTGNLLPDCYDDWIVPERERLRLKYHEALEHLIQQMEDERNHVAAQGFAQRLLQSDPLREEIYRHLMRLYLLNGDRAAALRAYQNCVTVLRRELDIEPSLATRQVYEQLVEASESPPSSLPLLRSLALVGRKAEWAWLQRTWHSAAQGKPQMALISGEAGIGKTRLAEELSVWVDRQGIPVCSTHCYEAEGTSAYAPLTGWLRDRPLGHLQPVWLAEVARLLPEVADRAPGLAPPGPLTEPWQRQRFHEALARAVLGPDLAMSSPLLLSIEDLHWCDRDTLEWLHYLLRFNPRARLLIVGTVRHGVATPNAPLSTVLAGLRRQGPLAEIALEPLTPAATTLLAKQMLGREIDAEAAACLYRETEGNPLFIVEFVRAGMVAAEDAAPQGTAVLPPLVQAAVSARLAQLSPAARQVMELAAIVGREFTFGVLALASGQDEDALVQALDELWQRRVIRERGRDAYDFGHNKVRQVVYAGLSRIRRRQLHKRVAGALAAVYARHAGMISGQIGWHYEQAGDDRSAALWLRRAGEMALQVGALSDALAYFDRTLALIPLADRAGRFAIVCNWHGGTRPATWPRCRHWRPLSTTEARTAPKGGRRSSWSRATIGARPLTIRRPSPQPRMP